jgi:two-component system nitrogen regulation sensor histidine kinase GlnL
MVLKNLIKARKGHAEPLSENAQLVDSGLLTGFEALPTVVLVLDKRTLRLRILPRRRCSISRAGN